MGFPEFLAVTKQPYGCFITCQNFFEILQVCSFDGMSVCLSVCLFHDTVHIVTAINTKLGTHMELASGYRCILFGVDDVTDDVTGLKSKSNFEIAINLLIFQIERRSKAGNIGTSMTYLDILLNCRYNFRFKYHADLKMAAILKISKYFR